MNTLEYLIDNKKYIVSIDETSTFTYGSQGILSQSENDITFNQKWYPKGYSVQQFLENEDYLKLKESISQTIKKVIENELSISTEGFNLSNYHNFVTNDEDHNKIVSKTRDLFENNFGYPVNNIIEKLERIVGFSLTDEIPLLNQKIHIIVRINRPFSTDYNPPHKDIYEALDEYSATPKMINFWIPIDGVTHKSSLPIASGSHLVPENEIVRTFAGGIMEGNKYRVRTIKSWGGKNELTRINITNGEVLVFSSYLIHGLAINEEPDLTRVALEFRLFKKD